jgi:phage tail sheath protein FI
MCDAETNTPDARETGRVVCEVSLAVTTPAEFIVVQLIQSADGAGLAD